MAVELKIKSIRNYSAYTKYRAKLGELIIKDKVTTGEGLFKEVMDVKLYKPAKLTDNLIVIQFNNSKKDTFIFNLKFYKECTVESYRNILGDFKLSCGSVINRYDLIRALKYFREQMAYSNEVLSAFYSS